MLHVNLKLRTALGDVTKGNFTSDVLLQLQRFLQLDLHLESIFEGS